MTQYHSQFWAQALTLQGAAGSIESLSRSISNARVDLNPHQVDAALFALRSPLSKGVILADEVGLGKTIEAGIVIAQRWAERRRRILLIVPATLRKQWQQELEGKFFLPSIILDSRSFKEAEEAGMREPFAQTDRVVICSYHFASSKAQEIRDRMWDLVVVDEAHRLRNVFKPSSKMARNISDAIGSFLKLLLTATPLQNSLMELYGLVSVIDDHVFGDPVSYRDQFVRSQDERTRNADLKERLRPICTRTLRKQVVEYIPFTRRVSLTQDFTPTDEEQRLYDLISAYLQRDQLIALPASQRTLITLVLRKLLASSTFAISGTLTGLIKRLEDFSQRHGLLDDEDLEGIEELEDEWEPPTDPLPQPLLAFDPVKLKEELRELRSYADLAATITANAKGDALLPALHLALERAQVLGAERKAIVFTESRRTQRYLFDLLSAHGFGDQLVLLNGSNSDPHSGRIYQEWLVRHAGEEVASGSRAVDIKAAIVEHFRDHATILIATEAAAEGVNLQFCSLVVNFDLPWNPQRVEQRIGRCHRYGQRHDVVVLNFINRRNEADQRVFQLLSEKFRLFEGVFGVSDEVLGALESGVDIERRIAQVYQTCRTPEEIAAAFDALQRELDEQIQARFAKTRAMLLENVDEEVSARLRVHRDKTLESLSERERWLLELTRFELPEVRFDPGKPRFQYDGLHAHRGFFNFDWKEAEKNGDIFYRQDHPLAVRIISQSLDRPVPPTTLTFNYTAHGAVVSLLKPFVGRSGWLELAKLTIESFDVEECLVFSARSDEGEPLEQDTCFKLMMIPATVGPPTGTPPDLAPVREQQVDRHLKRVDARNARIFDEEVLKLDHWSDDLKQGLEREIKEIDKLIRECRRTSALAASLNDKLEAQRQLKTHEGERNRKRRELFEAQDRIDRQRDDLIAKIEGQLKRRHSLTRLFTIRWTLV